MRFSFETDADEAMRASLAIIKVGSRGNRSAGAMMVSLFVVAFGIYLVRPELLVPVTVAAYVAVVLTLIAIQFEQRRRMRRALLNDPHTREEHRFDVREDGLTVSCDHMRSELTWSAIRRVIETKEFYLFFCGPFAAQYLPKRVFVDSGSEREVRELVSRLSPDRGSNLLGGTPSKRQPGISR